MIVLGNVSYLLNAKLNFHQDASLTCFPKKLDHVTIGSWCIQVLSALGVNGYQSPLSMRKCLTVVSKGEHCNLPGIVNVVRSSPDLEALVINMDFDSDKFAFASKLDPLNYDKDIYCTSQTEAFKCWLLHLKTVKVIGLTEASCKCELAILQFLLENGKMLEKMIINIGRIGGEDYSALVTSPEYLQLTKRLLSLPRSSPNSVLVLPS